MSKGKLYLALVSLALALNVTTSCSLLSKNEKPTPVDPRFENAPTQSYHYSELQIRNLDEMQEVVQEQIRKSQQFLEDDDTEQTHVALRSAVQFILSRPNPDNMVSQLMPAVRTKLREIGTWETALEEVVDEAIYRLRDKRLRPVQRATQYFVIENFLSELKPDSAMNEGVRKIFVKIRDAKIKLDSKVLSELKLRAMINKPSALSDIAARVLQPSK